ncbi:MAG: hypothetical protein RMI30_00070 [Thermodesulfovibrio sp.]|nr:hypothetical protein [Thermodesulfovibrio sp.]MDW7997836.1 hypothetical protein [Thermodesulfovibrio sp.]
MQIQDIPYYINLELIGEVSESVLKVKDKIGLSLNVDNALHGKAKELSYYSHVKEYIAVFYHFP